MNTIITFIVQKIIPNLAVIGVVSFTAVTSSVAAYRISQDLPPVQQLKNTLLVSENQNQNSQNNNTISENQVVAVSETPTPTVAESFPVLDSGIVKNNASLAVVSDSTLSTMTLAELATHNKAGNCYIGYNGIVYNVSNHASWSGCFHHGIGGGQDITSRFPHPVSYLSGLPRVANLTGGQVRNSNSTSTVEHETESEIENEKEKQETPNYEKTENHNGGENNGQDD